MYENTNNQAMPFDTRGRKPWLYLASDTSPIHFLVSSAEELTWYSGIVTDPPQTEQYESTDGEPLWWRDGETGGDMTVDPGKAFDPEDLSETPVPVMAYVYDIKQAAAVTFEELARDWGTALMPKFELGGGDPEGKKKARIYKDDTALRIEYDRAPGDEEEEGETYFFEIGDEGIKSNPELPNGNLILNRQPVPADAEELSENGVILVYDPNQPVT